MIEQDTGMGKSDFLLEIELVKLHWIYLLSKFNGRVSHCKQERIVFGLAFEISCKGLC